MSRNERDDAAANGSYYPIAFRTDNRRIVIIGGDEEAENKAHKLVASRARVTVVAASATDAIRALARRGEITLLERSYRDGDLAGAVMVFVCEVGIAPLVVEEAHRTGALVNVVDKIELCDFNAVAYVDRDGLQLAVHSSGRSAALARRIREELEELFPPAFGRLNRLLGALRPVVKRTVASSAARRKLWLDTVTRELLVRVRSTGLDEASLERALHNAVKDTALQAAVCNASNEAR